MPLLQAGARADSEGICQAQVSSLERVPLLDTRNVVEASNSNLSKIRESVARQIGCLKPEVCA